jgi:hypothetical protein
MKGVISVSSKIKLTTMFGLIVGLIRSINMELVTMFRRSKRQEMDNSIYFEIYYIQIEGNRQWESPNLLYSNLPSDRDTS